jgi:hypothetical protein
VDDASVAVVDQGEDAGFGVGSADVDGVEPVVVAQGDLAGLVDAVVADPVVGVVVVVAGARGGLGPSRVDRGRGRSVWQGAVGPVVVVLLDECVEDGLEVVDGGRLLGLGAEPLLHGLLEPLDLALGLGVVGLRVLLDDPESAELGLEAVAGAGALAAPGQAGGEDDAVVGQRGDRDLVRCNGFPEGPDDDGAGDPVVRGDREGVAGVVVEPGQDLAVRARSAVGSGESVVGEVGLPALVGLLGGEPDVGRVRSLLRLRRHQP